MATRKQLPQVQGITIHCAVCFNQGKMEPAFTVIKSYAVCEFHVPLISHDKFDPLSLRGIAKKHQSKGQEAT